MGIKSRHRKRWIKQGIGITNEKETTKNINKSDKNEKERERERD